MRSHLVGSCMWLTTKPTLECRITDTSRGNPPSCEKRKKKKLIKENTRSSGGANREITCWRQASESSAWCQQVIFRRAGVFLLYRTYLWNKQHVMSINLTTWSAMQYHVVVDHVVFYVIHSQVRYKSPYLSGVHNRRECALPGRHNERNGFSHYRHLDCLLSR